MPIHGHTKIELTSQTTGEVETIEKDNIVTNAVSQIFNAFNGVALLREANANGEYGSTSDKSWGCWKASTAAFLLYDTALGSDPTPLFAPPECFQGLVGSGVPKVLTTAGACSAAAFNATESKTDLENGVVTFVYGLRHQPGQRHDRQRAASPAATAGFFGERDRPARRRRLQHVSYYNSAVRAGDDLPQRRAKNDRHLYGRPLYADPENDEMVFGAISNNKLVLRYATALTTEIDLFNPINTTRVKKTEA